MRLKKEFLNSLLWQKVSKRKDSAHRFSRPRIQKPATLRPIARTLATNAWIKYRWALDFIWSYPETDKQIYSGFALFRIFTSS